DIAGYSSTGGTVMRTISPAPGGVPNPAFETYKNPSGPKVIDVGRNNPVAISSSVSPSRTRNTFPVNGVGSGLSVVFSRMYINPRLSKATPSTVVTPVTSVWRLPLGVTFSTFEEPFTIGNVFKLPT